MTRALIVALAIAMVLVSSVADAQTVCGPRTAFVEKLQKEYGQKPVSLGLTKDGLTIEVFASKKRHVFDHHH